MTKAPPTPAPRPRRGTTRRLAAGGALLLLGALGCSLLLAIALSRGIGREALREWLETALSRALAARVQIGALRGPLYPELELVGLSIERDGFAVRAERVGLRCAIGCGWPSKSFALDRLDVENARIALAPASGGVARESTALPRLRVSELRLRGISLVLAPQATPSAAAQARAPEPAAPAGLLRSGKLYLDGELHGVELTPQGLRAPSQGELVVRATDAVLGPRAIARLDASVHLRGAELSIDPLDVQSDAGALSGGIAHARLRDPLLLQGPPSALFAALSLQARLEEFDAAAWSPWPALRSALSGPLEIRAEAAPDGGPTPAELELRAQLRSSGAGAGAGAPIEALEVEAALRANGDWELVRTRATGRALSLEASGAGSSAGIESLRVQGEFADVCQLRLAAHPGWPCSGRARFTANASGPWSQLSGELSLKAEALQLGASARGELVARAHARSGRLDIEELRFRAGRERLELRGWIDSGARAELQASARALELARIPGELTRGVALAGRLSGDVALRGALARPDLQAALRAEDVRAGALPPSRLALELRAEGARAVGQIRFDPPTSARISASFALPYPAQWRLPQALELRDPAAHIDVQARQLELADLSAWTGLAPADIAGGVSLDARVAGSPKGPRLSGQAQLAAVRSAGAHPALQLGPVDGTVRFEQISPWIAAGPALRVAADLHVTTPQARWPARFRGVIHHWLDRPRLGVQIEEFEAAQGEQRIRASGELAGLRAAPLRVQVSALELGPLAAAAALPLGGRLDAQVEFEGALLAGPAVTGALAWADPSFAGAQAERLTIEFGSRGSRLAASGRLEAFGALAARAQLDAPGPFGRTSLAQILADPSTRFELRSEQLDVRWLAPWFPSWMRDAQGVVTADLHASGAAGEPELSGTLVVVKASARVPLLEQRIGPLEARAHLENRALVLDRLRVNAPGRGHIEAHGELALDSLRPRALSLRADLSGFPLSRSAAAHFALGGWAELRGPLDALVFSGDLAVREGRFEAPERRDAIWKEIQVLRASAAEDPLADAPAGSTAFERARGSLRIQVPADTWLRLRGAELEVTGALDLRKDRGEPVRYFGALDVARGSYQLGRRRLLVERGSLELGGRDRIDPRLDVLASSQLGDYRVEVSLTGPLSNPVIEPRSDPPLPRADVLALLLFGRPTAQLEQDRAGALSSALAVLGTEFAAEDLRSRLARLLPFDTFSVGVDQAGSGARVEVGRYVGQGVFLSYGRNIAGTQPGDAVQLEWRLTPSLRLQSETSAQGQAGADLIWRLDY